MQKEQFDEYQLLKRHRIGFHTLILTIFLIVINGVIKEYYLVWAPPMIEAIVLLYIPATYFAVKGTAQNAYLRRKDRPIFTLILFGVATLLWVYLIISSISLGVFTLIENGQLSHGIVYLVSGLFFGSTFVALLIRRMLDRRIIDSD